jgi:hypothetical protein
MGKFWQRAGFVGLMFLWALATMDCASVRTASVPASVPTSEQADEQPQSIPLAEYPADAGPVTIVVFPRAIFGFRNIASRDCEAEHHACYQKCKQTKPRWPVPFGGARHAAYCATLCLAEYMACLGAEATQRTFEDMRAAADWLSRNPQVVGSAIVVIGVGVFIVATDGAGIVLVPWAQQQLAR